MSHAPQIEESYLTHIYLWNVCVSVPPKILAKSGKKWQKWQKWKKMTESCMQKVAESGNSGKHWNKLVKMGKSGKKTKIKLAVGQRKSSIL